MTSCVYVEYMHEFMLWYNRVETKYMDTLQTCDLLLCFYSNVWSDIVFFLKLHYVINLIVSIQRYDLLGYGDKRSTCPLPAT